jgi:polyisoprenoid-binding protein YceI
MRFCSRTLLLFAAAFTHAQSSTHKVTVTLIPSQTAIKWTLGDVLHTVHGTFKLADGVVSFDPQSGAADGLIEVTAASGESGSSARDQNMHKNVLESARYPVISFRPTNVSGKFDFSADQELVVSGIFRLHGADHPLQLQLHINAKQNSLTATTHFVVPYVQWGLKDPSNFLLRVNKTVDIDVESVGTVCDLR